MEQVPDVNHLTFGQFVMWLLAVAVTAALARGTWRKSGPSNSSENTLTVPTEGNGPDATINTTGMSPSLVASLTEMSASLGYVMKKNSEHEDRITRQDIEINSLKADLGRAHEALRAVHTWIEGGKTPPDPRWPDWLKR